MEHTVFFAWQLDTPSEQNKTFIWNALRQATTVNIEQSPRPESDTTGVSGAPNIVETIFERIRNCAFFVADLTFVCETRNRELIPNPNVLIELGYAARSIGWKRIILVINEEYGDAKNLPFDILQHRFPIKYKLSTQTKVEEKRFTQLSNSLKEALLSCERYSLERAQEMADILDTTTIEIIAEFENKPLVDLVFPSRTVNEYLYDTPRFSAIQRLISIGALRLTDKPKIGYEWTYDGRCMIEALVKKHPLLLESFRNYRQGR